jgi:hypothetical protein
VCRIENAAAAVTGAFVGSIPTPRRSLSGVVAPGTYNLRVVATNRVEKGRPHPCKS